MLLFHSFLTIENEKKMRTQSATNCYLTRPELSPFDLSLKDFGGWRNIIDSRAAPNALEHQFVWWKSINHNSSEPFDERTRRGIHLNFFLFFSQLIKPTKLLRLVSIQLTDLIRNIDVLFFFSFLDSTRCVLRSRVKVISSRSSIERPTDRPNEPTRKKREKEKQLRRRINKDEEKKNPSPFYPSSIDAQTLERSRLEIHWQACSQSRKIVANNK